MSTWQTIFGVDSPIRGSTAEFATARDAFGAMRDDADAILGQFDIVREHGSAPDHLEGDAGDMLARLLEEMDGGLRHLPEIAGEARAVFASHHDKLVDLHELADEALARAVTAWGSRNDAQERMATLERQHPELTNPFAFPTSPVGPATSDTDGLAQARTEHTTLRETRERAQGDLDAIYGGGDSEWHRLRGQEDARIETTVDELDDIDLGDLEDPGFFDKLVGGITDFIGGVLESVANLLEAFVTGDWATFFWELKGLMDVALLVLGTIALFTGIGGPLGVALIALSLASFAVNTGLYLTQTPNPQTGQTVGLGDVVVSGVAAVFAGVSVFQVARTAARSGTTFSQTFSAANAPGFRNGAIANFVGNLGRNSHNGVNTLLRQEHVYPVAAGQQRWFTTLGYPASLTPVVTYTGYPGAAPSRGDRFGGTMTVGGFDGFRRGTDGHGTPTGSGPSSPLFAGPQPTPQQVARVTRQMRDSPDVHIVPAG